MAEKNNYFGMQKGRYCPGRYGLDLIRLCRLAVLVLLVCCFLPSPARSEEGQPPVVDAESQLTLDDCVKAALTTSPYIKMDTLSIEMKKLDVDNEWFHMFPKVNLLLGANTPIGGDNTVGTKYTVTLTSDTYDPLSAYFEHDAQRVLLRLAKLDKLKTASQLIKNVAILFLQKQVFEATTERQQRLEELAREGLAYATRMFPEAPTVPLEVRMAEHEVKRIQAEERKARNSFTNQMMRLKRMLGIPAEQKLELAGGKIEEMLFQSFRPNELSFEEVEARSLFQRMERCRRELADYGVYAAWADYVPTFSFSVRTPDPIGDSSSDDNYYMTFSATVPLFHWGELGRNVDHAEKQKSWVKNKSKAERVEREDRWYLQRSKVTELHDDLDIAAAEVEVNKLAVRRMEILFNSGRTSFKELIAKKMELVKSEVLRVNAEHLYLAAKLEAFAQSGLLLDRFIHVENLDDYDEQ